MNKTLEEVILTVDELNPNAYSSEVKAMWVNEAEHCIQTEIFCLAPCDITEYSPYSEKKNLELSLGPGDDKLYILYLQAMIDFANKEYSAYNNDIALYNECLDTFAKRYVRTHREGAAPISGMCVSAFALAQKHGFEGTEDEWLASLKGERGEKGDKGEKGERGEKGEKGEQPDLSSGIELTPSNPIYDGVYNTKITGSGISSTALSGFDIQTYYGYAGLKLGLNDAEIKGHAIYAKTNYGDKVKLFDDNESGGHGSNDFSKINSLMTSYGVGSLAELIAKISGEAADAVTSITLNGGEVLKDSSGNIDIPTVTEENDGLMSATDKDKLDDTYTKEEIDEKLNALSAPRYGVKFGGSANSGATVQRLYNAFGLTANVGTDTETAINDFDRIYPWSGRRRCCGYWNSEGSFIVNAYEGGTGYTTDGSNGEVWVETPLFFYKHTYNDDGSEEIVISNEQKEGYNPSPIHINADGSLRQFAYTAAYPMALVNDKPTSRSGVYTPVMSLNSGMANARKLGDKYTTTTAAEQYTICLLMWVEFATRDIQTKMKGCSLLPYSADHKATISENATNRIIISKNYATAYVIGQGIAVGTSLGGANIANNRTVTEITDYDETNSAISFDGDPVNIEVGNIVFSVAWKTGSCDNVLPSSGSPVSNASGKYTCIYRGEETPFGNTLEWISDVLFKREGAGTTEDPYSYDIYFLKDPTKYSNGAVTEDYTKINFQLPTAEGYVKKLGFDSRFPWLRIPCEVGASSTTYYADYYYRPGYAVTAACVGGHWYHGSVCGPCCWGCNATPSDLGVVRRARLSYHH